MAVSRTALRGSIGAGPLGRITRDERAQVSFSVVAVAVLLLAAAAGSYFAKKELDEADDARRERMIELMSTSADEVRTEVGLVAASEAYALVSGWDEYPVNETRLSAEYAAAVRAYLIDTFPRTQSGLTTSVSNWSGALHLLEKQTSDISPPDEPEPAQMELDGTEMEYESLPPQTTDGLAVTTANPYYVALGNLTVSVRSEDVSLSKDLSFDRPIISALPLLETKLRAFEAASEGEFSDMGQMVACMLTTLAQLRVLEGYGVPTYTGMDTASILTEADAYRAVAVALLVEQARLFRSVDASFAAEVVAACGGTGIGLAALEGQDGGYLDTAELFMWFLGRTEPDIDPRLLVAQAVAGMADQLVLKTMDYMGWLGMLGLADRALDAVEDSVAAIVCLLTGEDMALESVVGWVRRAIELTSQLPELYLNAFSWDQDLSVTVPERTYFVENASGGLYPVWVGGERVPVDLPVHEILSSGPWADFYPEFKEHQGDLTDLVYDSLKRLAFDVASTCTVGVPGTSFDPTDGEDLFTTMSEGVGEVEVALDPGAVLEVGSDLPMFSAQYGLSQAFSAFVADNSARLVPWDMSEIMFDEIAEEVLEGARYPFIPDLVVPVGQQLQEVVRSDIECSGEWGVGDDARAAFEARYMLALEGLSLAMLNSVEELDDGFAGPLVDSVAAALVAGTDAFPGLEQVVEEALGAFARAALAQGRMSAFKGSAYVDTGGVFEFWDGDRTSAEEAGTVLNASLTVEVPGGLPGLTVVPYDEASGFTSLDGMFPADELLVQVKRPWDHDRGAEGYPNSHLTSLTNASATPYSTQWLVSVKGLVRVSVTSSDSYMVSALGPEPAAGDAVLVSLCVPIVTQSAWPLERVEYNPTDTVFSDALEVAVAFKDYLWGKLEPALGWVRDGLEAIHHFVQDAFRTLATFSMKVLKVVAKCVQTVVETLQTYLQKFADSALAKAVRLFVDLVGNVEVRVSVYGFTLIIQTNLPDLLYRKAQDLVRIIVCTDRLGPGIAFGFRVAKLSDGRYDVVVNGTVAFDSGTVEVVIDPLMVVQRRLVEVHCRTDSWGLDMSIPEVEPYESAQVSTADMPGLGALLSNIPVPVLGVKASVEAGLKLKYSPPFPTDVVVNEFEANPEGEDSGREWAELYNPLDEPRCLDGWTLGTLHGETYELPLQGTVPAKGLLLVTFPETAVDNGYPDDPFNDGDSLILYDPEGRTVDVTPTLRDSANDGRTHQRTWDGGPKWALEAGTKGASNGASFVSATSDFIAKALFSAFKEAFDETQLTEVSASLDFVVLLAKRVIHHFIENLLSIVEEIIHEVTLFVQVTFTDAAGAAGAGVRASFVVTGEAVTELLRWLVHSLAVFIVNLGRAANPVAYPTFPDEFFSGLFLRFEVLFEVGAPRVLSSLGAVDGLPDRLTCAVSVAPNIPCLGRLAGRDWGQWRVEFGVCLEGLPRECVSGFMVKETGDTVDLWLVKGCAYGV